MLKKHNVEQQRFNWLFCALINFRNNLLITTINFTIKHFFITQGLLPCEYKIHEKSRSHQNNKTLSQSVILAIKKWLSQKFHVFCPT